METFKAPFLLKIFRKERGKILCSSEDSHFPTENKEDY